MIEIILLMILFALSPALGLCVLCGIIFFAIIGALGN